MAQVGRTRNPCPECGAEVRPADVRVGPTKRAVALYAAAGVVTLVWIVLLLAWQPVFLVPTNLAGGVLVGAIYLAPGLIVGLIAAAIPRERRLRCSKCRTVSVSSLAR